MDISKGLRYRGLLLFKTVSVCPEINYVKIISELSVVEAKGLLQIHQKLVIAIIILKVFMHNILKSDVSQLERVWEWNLVKKHSLLNRILQLCVQTLHIPVV